MTKRGLPSLASLRARGWTVLPSTGKGYGLPAAPATPAEPPSWHDTCHDHVVALLLAEGVEVTRQNWIDLSYGAEPPSPWDAECEAQLPVELQDWTQVLLVD
jgi:hypothetical protein